MFALLRFLELLSKADTFPFIYFIVARQISAMKWCIPRKARIYGLFFWRFRDENFL